MKPLVCDLDETLVKTDCFYEAMALLIKTNPLYLLYFPIWLSKGLPNFKNQVFSRVSLDIANLPYNHEVINFIKNEKAKGRQIVLATATPEYIAIEVNDYLGLFDLVLGTNEKINLKSHNKTKKLNELFGEKGYDYIGDSLADINVWKSADKAYLVAKTNYSKNKILDKVQVEKIIFEYDNFAPFIIKEIRVYQWIKNILLFIPLLLAHKFIDSKSLLDLLIAFFSFNFIASSVYILNDMSDLKSDRLHRSKKYRPFAAGHLRLQYAFILVPLLIFLSLFSALTLLNIKFLFVLLFYFVVTSLYSVILKRIPIIDILVLASLYAIRIIAGSVVAEVYLSPWLLGFTLFFFLSLAIVKRFTELNYLLSENIEKTHGRGYEIRDISMLRVMGITSGFLSIMVLVLYLNSEEVRALYTHPSYLWGVAPLLLYWLMNMWFIAERGNLNDDPVVFAAKNISSYLVMILIAIIMFLAI